jgi:hypothetical protein
MQIVLGCRHVALVVRWVNAKKKANQFMIGFFISIEIKK